MNKKAILICAVAVAVIAVFALLMTGGVISVVPKTATEKEFGKTVLHAEMILEGYEDIPVQIELYPDVAPKTVANFVKLVNEKFYDGLVFHRIVKDVIAQTGSPTGDGYGGSSETVKGEFKANGVNNTIRHRRGVLSMARLPDNYNSATSQFFVVLCAEGSEIADFNGQYAAFGRIVSGMQVLDAISALPVLNETPVNPPKIVSIAMVD